MSEIDFYPMIENEVLVGATALWRTGTNGDYYKLFLSEGDFDRLVEEFGEPQKVLTFTRFTVEVESVRTENSFVSGDTAFTYLRHPPRLVDLSLVPKTNPA
jgi:hypothetical protein